MSFLTESEAASMGFRKEGSLIARLRCFTRSRVSLAQAILRVLFWAGVHQTVHHTGAHPCNLNQLNMDAKNQNASFRTIITFSKHFQTIIFSMQVEFPAWNPPPIWGLGEWLLAQAVYFAMEICIYEDIFNLISLLVYKLGHLSLPNWVKRWNYKNIGNRHPAKLGVSHDGGGSQNLPKNGPVLGGKRWPSVEKIGGKQSLEC